MWPSGFRAIFVPFLIQKSAFFTSFCTAHFDIQELHLLLLSKMEVQAENGAKNY